MNSKLFGLRNIELKLERLKFEFKFPGSSTLPRTTTRTDSESGRAGDKVAAATSSTSLYDNVATSNSQTGGVTTASGGQTTDGAGTGQRPVKSETGTMTSTEPMSTSVGTQNHVGSQSQEDGSTLQRQETSKSEGTQAGGTLQQSHKSTTSTGTEMHHNIINNNTSTRRSKSKSTEDMNIFSDSSTLKRMMKPMPSTESPVTSPEMTRRRYNYYNTGTNTMHSHQHGGMHNSHILNNNTLSRPPSQTSRFSGSR